MRKHTAIILLTLALAMLGAATASAKSAQRWYVPRAHHACRTHYRREHVRVDKTRRVHRHGHMVTIKVRRHGHVVKVRQVRCVRRHTLKKPTTAAPAPVISYKANVDPSFTQSPTNPLAVTYSYSADATETVNGTPQDLGAEDQLPAGVLNFYSATTPGGSVGLVCSMNVGGSTTGGSCPVTVAATGSYSVTTEYIPNSAGAVTETDSETIAPFSTTSALVPSTSGGTTTYTDAVTDQNGNPVTPSAAGIEWVVTDSTTGQVVGDFANLPDSVYFEQVTDTNPVTHMPEGQAVAIYVAGQAVPTASGNFITPGDSFTVQAIYTPAEGSTVTGSTSPAQSLVLSR